MQLNSHYREQARLSLKNLWGKSALSFLTVILAITLPVVIVAVWSELASAPALLLLAFLFIIAALPVTLGLCVAFLQHTRTSEANFLQNTWRSTIKNYGRFLGSILLLYLISMFISGVVSVLSAWAEHDGSLLSLLISIPAMLWMLFLMLQVCYGYRLTPYLLHDNPDMKVIDAMKQSYQMMKGYKRILLALDLSIMQWYIYAIIVGIILFCIGGEIDSMGIMVIGGIVYVAALVGVLFLYPYLLTTSALFYTDRLAESTEPEEDKAEVPSAEETESPSQL